jgi:hypothetical protein
MGRKPVEIHLTEENIETALKKGDIIQEAEELGVVVSARMTVHNNGTAFVYFMGGDVYKEMFGIPQTLTVLRDPEGLEYEWTGRPLGTHVMVEISKAGGGTVGRRYIGDWTVRITQNGKVVCEDVMRVRTRNLTHEEAARAAYCFVDEQYAADHPED